MSHQLNERGRPDRESCERSISHSLPVQSIRSKSNAGSGMPKIKYSLRSEQNSHIYTYKCHVDVPCSFAKPPPATTRSISAIPGNDCLPYTICQAQIHPSKESLVNITTMVTAYMKPESEKGHLVTYNVNTGKGYQVRPKVVTKKTKTHSLVVHKKKKASTGECSFAGYRKLHWQKRREAQTRSRAEARLRSPEHVQASSEQIRRKINIRDQIGVQDQGLLCIGQEDWLNTTTWCGRVGGRFLSAGILGILL